MLIVGLVLCGIYLWSIKSNEPQFQGKSLSSWLAKLNTGRFDVVDLNPVLDAEAVQAIQQIGEPAVPFLISRLKSALAAEWMFYRLQDWPTKLPFKFMEPKLDRRMILGQEAVLGFVALGEKGKIARSELEGLIPKREGQSGPVFQAIVASGQESIGILSNSLQSSDYWLKSHAVQAMGHLGKSSDSLVPRLVAMLEDQEHELISNFIVRALGQIGEPSQVVIPALRRCLQSTNDSLAGNAAVGLMFMGGHGREAVPEIEKRLVTREGKVNVFAVLSLVVLSTNDGDLVLSLAKAKALRISNEFDEASDATERKPPQEVFARIRNSLTNCDARERQDLFADIRALIPVNRTN